MVRPRSPERSCIVGDIKDKRSLSLGRGSVGPGPTETLRRECNVISGHGRTGSVYRPCVTPVHLLPPSPTYRSWT